MRGRSVRREGREREECEEGGEGEREECEEGRA